MPPLIAMPAYPPLPRGRVKGWDSDGIGVPARYVYALRHAGATEAIMAPTPLSGREADVIVDRYDGLMLLGGGDLDPTTYGQEARAEVYSVSADRDACELALCRASIRAGTPILAICRGIQVLNVALGGTLDQHITGRPGLGEHGTPGQEGGEARTEVTVVPATRLAVATGTTKLTCSCHHHQAIDMLGVGLDVVAQTADGVVEAVEFADLAAPWVVGVQWHPEDTAASDPAQQRLFEAFVEEAAARQRAG